MVQFSKRDDGIGSRIRAISGRFTRRDAIYLLREVRRVVGRAPRRGRCHSLSNFPICPTVGMVLRGRSGFGQMRIKSPAWWVVGGLVGALHRRHVIRSARTCGEDEGLYWKGGKRHGSLVQPLVPANQIKAPKDPSGECGADSSWLDILGPVVHYAGVAGERADREQGHGGSFEARRDERARRGCAVDPREGFY